jgi:hypothetical protein
MRLPGLARQYLSHAVAERPLCPSPLGLDLGEPEERAPLTRDHEEIDPSRDKIGPETEALAADALDAVPLHRTTDLPRDDEPEPGIVAGGGCDEEDEVGRDHPASPGVRGLDSLEVSVLPDPPGTREAPRSRQAATSCRW